MSLGGSYKRGGKKRGPAKPPTPEEIAKRLKEMKAMAGPNFNYRERSLAIHGLICAKCAREFERTGPAPADRPPQGRQRHATTRPTVPTGRTSASTATRTSTAAGVLGDYLEARTDPGY